MDTKQFFWDSISQEEKDEIIKFMKKKWNWVGNLQTLEYLTSLELNSKL